MHRAGRRSGDGPRPMRVGVQRVLRHLQAPDAAVVESVFSRWEELVGELIGSHSRPTKIVDGTLHIEVDDAAWASEMRWMSADLLKRLETSLESNEINEIVVHLQR